jgi:hypothetical protein
MTPGESRPVLTKTQSELIAFLFEGQPNLITAPLTRWVAISPRYTVFVEKYKDKIRKKIRVTREKEAIEDLFYELQIPFLLLQERRFDLAYEPYLSGKTRGPDFSVTFRTNFAFNIEVTRVRGLRKALSAPTEAAIDFRLIDVLCGKLRQMLPKMANLLMIEVSPDALEQLDPAAQVAWVKDKAESRDQRFYARHRFLSPADFFKYYKRLSALVLYNSANERKPVVWLNPQAGVGLPDAVRTILQRGFAQP